MSVLYSFKEYTESWIKILDTISDSRINQELKTSMTSRLNALALCNNHSTDGTRIDLDSLKLFVDFVIKVNPTVPVQLVVCPEGCIVTELVNKRKGLSIRASFSVRDKTTGRVIALRYRVKRDGESERNDYVTTTVEDKFSIPWIKNQIGDI